MSQENELVQVEMGVRLTNGNFTRNIYKHVDEIPKVRKKFKNRGVYVSAYRYDKAEDKANSLLIGDLYLDLDINDLKDMSIADMAFEKIREDAIKAVGFLQAICHIDADMIQIYFSGQKGLHIIVPHIVLGIHPMKELNHIFGFIAKEINGMTKHKTIDTGIYDNARLFSLPGGIHPESGRYKIPLSLQELRTLSFRQVRNLAKKPREIAHKTARYNTKSNRVFQSYIASYEKEEAASKKRNGKGGKSTLSFCPPCIKSILTRQCLPGARNNTAAALSSYFKQRGYSEKKGWDKLTAWNDRFAGLSETELTTTFKSIYRRDYTYGCSTLEQLGNCIKNECKIGQQKK